MANVKRRRNKQSAKYSSKSVDKYKNIFLQAQHLHQTGLLTEAENLYKNILENIPDNPDCLHYLGLIYLQKGNDSKAESYLKKAIKFSNNPIYLSNYGLLLRKQLKFNEALNIYKKAIELQPDYAEAWYNYGITKKDLGEYKAAEEAYKKAISIKNDYIKALYNLTVVQEYLGKSNEASETIQKIQNISPVNYQLYHTMGIAMQNIGGSENIKKALFYFKQALELEPNSLETLIALARLQKESNKPETALKIYEKILSIEPNYYEIRIEHADCLAITGDVDQAEQKLLEMQKADPEDLSVILSLGNIASVKGKFLDAEEKYKKVLTYESECTAAYAGLANCKKYTVDDMEFINELKACAEKHNTANIYYALGKIYNDINMYDDSFQAYKQANKIKNKRINYDKNSYTELIDQTIKIVNKELIKNNYGNGNDSELPVFILGTPRSGTTLTEQIISSHPLVVGGGELQYIEQLAKHKLYKYDEKEKYPERLLNITKEEIQIEAEMYLDKISSFIKQEKILRVTDKMTINFMHIGYIFMLLPKAKIIHCKRNPLDACISMFFQNFSSHAQYCFDLENLGHWYKEYLRLMQHWKSIFGDRILDIDYDVMINNTEDAARQLINYCELDWDNTCMEFYKTERDIRTASLWQVRQPIYKTSLNRWKKYDNHIGDLKEILAGYY